MLYWGDKPDYERQDVKVEIKPLLRVHEYDSLSILKLTHYLNSIIDGLSKKDREYVLDKDIQIQFTTHEESEGFGYPETYIELQPYYMRKETDEEYNNRISEEEESYRKNEEIKKLKEQEHEQYLTDLAEYNRIRDKYHLS